jgi:hypothetical protein
LNSTEVIGEKRTTPWRGLERFQYSVDKVLNLVADELSCIAKYGLGQFYEKVAQMRANLKKT